MGVTSLSSAVRVVFFFQLSKNGLPSVSDGRLVRKTVTGRTTHTEKRWQAVVNKRRDRTG